MIRIRIRMIHKVPDDGSNLDPDPQHWIEDSYLVSYGVENTVHFDRINKKQIFYHSVVGPGACV